MNHPPSEYHKQLKHLRDLISTGVSDHLIRRYAEHLSKRITPDHCRQACRHFADTFEKKPHKMFPDAKDFVNFKPQTEKAKAKVEEKEHPSWIRECAHILGKHPSEIPHKASMMTKADRKKCGILEPEEIKAGWAQVYAELDRVGVKGLKKKELEKVVSTEDYDEW